MPQYKNALVDAPANRLAYTDSVGAVPRNEYLGALADFLAQSYAPQRTQQMQGVSQFLQVPAVAQTLDRLSYGEPLTTGAGGLGGTTRIRPEALDAAMALAPLYRPAGMAAKGVEKAAMATGRAGERLAERVVPQIMERGGMPAQLLSDLGRGTVRPLDVYHGTPHKFDKFDSSKIGTGEGMQAYGHGIYMAENPAVASEYAKNIMGPKATPENIALKVINATGDESVAATRLKQIYPKMTDAEIGGAITTAKSYQGNLYKADLPDKQIKKMLDYDKHLSEQSPEVQKILAPYQKEIGSSFGTGEQTLKAIAFERRMKGLDDSPAAVAQQLKEMGIPGVRYLDDKSRGVSQNYVVNVPDFGGYDFPSLKEAKAFIKSNPQMKTELIKPQKTTSNFVVFPGEEQSMTILERNGQPVNALAKGKR